MPAPLIGLLAKLGAGAAGAGAAGAGAAGAGAAGAGAAKAGGLMNAAGAKGATSGGGAGGKKGGQDAAGGDAMPKSGDGGGPMPNVLPNLGPLQTGGGVQAPPPMDLGPANPFVSSQQQTGPGLMSEYLRDRGRYF